jgi:methyl-accepting chemotaxis protein WspA
MRNSLETARRADQRGQGTGSSFQRTVPPLFERYVELATQLASAAGDSSPQTGEDRSPDRFIMMASAAQDAGVTLGETSIQELRSLLAGRIAQDRRSRSEVLLMSLFCVGLAVAVMVVVTRNITRPLGCVVSLTSQIAAGRVKEAMARLQSAEFKEFLVSDGAGGAVAMKDEIFRLILSVSTMTESLNMLLAKVTLACVQVAASATQTAAAVRQVDAAVAEQAASTNEINATSREIFANAQDLARTMGGVTRMAAEAAKTAGGGVSRLEGIHSAIDELTNSSHAITHTFESINEKTGNIDKVITTITKVANRTNLLSLNASIEAEKAGEKAGGFSVVALEMRRLADQTAVAALDIEKQIREMQRTVQEGVSSVASYVHQTQASSTAATDLSSGLGSIIASTTKLGPEFEAVSNGMKMQSQGAGQIAEAMQQLRDAATQTKDTLTEFRRVCDDLNGAVRDLNAEVGRFSTAA